MHFGKEMSLERLNEHQNLETKTDKLVPDLISVVSGNPQLRVSVVSGNPSVVSGNPQLNLSVVSGNQRIRVRNNVLSDFN